MRRIIAVIFTLFTVFSVFNATGQSYFTAIEMGFSGGASQYFGDLNEHYGLKSINGAGGLYARKRMNAYIAIKTEINFTNVGYKDSYNTDPFDKERNLSFNSSILEGAIEAEFNFFGFITGDKTHRYTPYLLGGIGAFTFDPYTTYNGQKYYLQPLGTEGQNAGYSDRKYSSVAACFPIGVGVKYWIKGGINLTMEIADRLTSTDYLDDVSATYVGLDKFPANSVAAALQDRSNHVNNPTNTLGEAGKQRGNTSSYDQYMLAIVSISFNFKTYKCPQSQGFDDQMRVR